jgi:hypothetical protein
MCATLNQPVDSLFSVSIPIYVWVGAAVLAGILVLAAVSK